MREQEIRVVRDTLRKLEEMQAHLTATEISLRAMLVCGHEHYIPDPLELAAYAAEHRLMEAGL
jgi:hypothetical protein